MDGEYVDLGFLPFSEAKANKTLAGFLKYVGKDNANAFAVYGFEAVLAFQQAADDRGEERPTVSRVRRCSPRSRTPPASTPAA